jgi:hypothetical protein
MVKTVRSPRQFDGRGGIAFGSPGSQGGALFRGTRRFTLAVGPRSKDAEHLSLKQYPVEDFQFINRASEKAR